MDTVWKKASPKDVVLKIGEEKNKLPVKSRVVFTFLILTFLIHYSPSQTSDTLQTHSVTHIDSITAKKVGKDTARKESGLEGPVKYTADKITFAVQGKKSFLEGNVQIEYQNMTLEAGQVEIDWNKNTMTATGMVDSTDSLGNPVYKGLPVFKERGNKPIYGERLTYNFKTRRGKVLEGRTTMEPGYYQGEEIKKIGVNTLLVREGYFTSCDSIDHPHYYFKARKMRILMKKRAVAKPIVMYIADVPILAIPFGVFPMERGRRSGIIIPTYGESSYGGRYLRDFGYYWAASQYWDLTLLANFFERTGTAYQGEIRYLKRYAFSGNISGRYAPKDVTTGRQIQRWSLRFSHNQTLSETMNLNASGNFVSDKSFIRDFSHNLQDRLNQQLSTNVTFSKRWPSSKNSLTASASRDENLQTGELSYTLPRLSFNHTQSAVFPFNAQASGKRHWYHDIFYDYGSDFISRGSKRLQNDSTFRRETTTGWQHSSRLSFNRKILKYLKYNQSARINELWVPEYLEYRWVDSLNTAVPDTVKGFRSRHTFTTGIGASTTLYGLFEIPFSPLRLIRHKMDPSINFSFSPDFTEPRFGYVQTFRDSTGRIRKFDRFRNNPFGGTSSAESRRMNISINNLFQGKIIKDGQEKKIDLFNLNMNASYNFLADSLKWSNIRSSLRARASKDFDFTLSATHSLYEANRSGFGDRNEYVWENGFSLPRLLNVNLNARIHLKPPEKKTEEKPETPADTTEAGAGPAEEDVTVDPEVEGLKKFKLPWDLTANLTYSLDRRNSDNIRKRLDARISGRIEVTKNWRVEYSSNIDLINKKINYHSFNIYRDLHCWEMSFSWAPNPQGYSFYTLRIQIKEAALRDIKLTKSSGGRRPFQ